MLLNCGVGEDSWESLGLQGDPTVHPKGNQSWIFIGRTDAKAETPVLWPPHAKSWLIGKDPDAGRDWGQEEKGTTEDEMAGWHHRLNGREFEWTPGVGDDREAWHAAIHGVTKRVGHNWVTELNWTEQLTFSLHYIYYCKFSSVQLNLLAVQGTQESSPTPQFKNINSLVLSLLHSVRCNNFYMVTL